MAAAACALSSGLPLYLTDDAVSSVDASRRFDAEHGTAYDNAATTNDNATEQHVPTGFNARPVRPSRSGAELRWDAASVSSWAWNVSRVSGTDEWHEFAVT